ncbi:MAG: DinB family protein [Cyclobacteriaceae bacterium]
MGQEFTGYITSIIERDLNKLEEEIKLYPSDESIWKLDGQIKNTAGNLCLHLCGNLQHYIGAVLGKSDYQRNRDLEFSEKGISKAVLITTIQTTRMAVKSALDQLHSDSLEKEYPEKVFNYPMTTSYFLIHLCAHLGYHLGQINYHRRLLG